MKVAESSYLDCLTLKGRSSLGAVWGGVFCPGAMLEGIGPEPRGEVHASQDGTHRVSDGRMQMFNGYNPMQVLQNHLDEEERSPH